MRRMSSDEIRESYLSFFEARNHLRSAGAGLVPINDPSLMVIGAGMAPLKPYFTGAETPPSPRMTTVQRCIRTPDIERVGVSGRHGTSFEMLGNFSFGDYFKTEAIHWAWEYVTDVLGLPAEKLYITVHRDDDEAYNIWHDEIRVPPERILRLGDEDNFWEIGVGPCGPDSEIFIDRGPEFGCGKPDCAMGCDCDRFLEIWNLVFTQFDKDKEGNLHALSRRCIDTGMGLDRVAMVLQEKHSLVETDLFQPLFQHMLQITGVDYDGQSKESIALRIICDHIKGVVFMISDGILPGNERANYVLKRLLRRAARYGRMLGIGRPFMAEASGKMIDTMAVGYPELETKRDFILQVIDSEEKHFHETLEAGLHLVNQHVETLKRNMQTLLDGEIAFQLHDTFGFPLELTQEVLAESGLGLQIEGFYSAMQKQRDLARAARGDVDAMNIGRRGLVGFLSSFVGYDQLSMEGKVIGIWQNGEQVTSADAGSEVEVVFDQTPFYAASGGQVADEGIVLLRGEALELLGLTKEADITVHKFRLGEEGLAVDDTAALAVKRSRRDAISRHHSATHLLHSALRKELGQHVQQAGSLVDENRLRFDFTHFQALTPEQLLSIEKQVNDIITGNSTVVIRQTGMAEAQQLGAIALFGEKYGELVRVVRIGESMELCGGCHVKNSAEIGLFHILSESSIGSGVRRIEAVAGLALLDYLRENEALLGETAQSMKVREAELPAKVMEMQREMRDMQRELDKLKAASVKQSSDMLLQSVQDIGGVPVLVAQIEAPDAESLRQAADFLRDKMGSGVVFLAAVQPERIALLAAATKDVADRVHSGNLIRETSKQLDGRGGGRPDMAQGAGSVEAVGKLASVLESVPQLIAVQLQG